MMRGIIGGTTLASVLMPKKRRRKKMMMPSMGAMGIIAGAGIAYMAMRRNKENNDENID
jgi:uncharacterized membrane protein YebE (DUF533 family)